jgi:sporulation protein YlmC with PRC-barrel domain
MKGLRVFAAAALVGLPLSAALAQQPSQEQTQSPGTQSGGAQSGQAGIQITSDSLVGTDVRDSEGKEIGEVSQLMIDPKEGKVTSVVIKQGGAMGFGGKDVSVPWNALKIQRDQDKVVVTVQREMLEKTEPAASPQTSPQDQQQQKQ